MTSSRLRGGLLGAGLIAAAALVPTLVSDPVVLDLAVFSAYYLLLAGSWNLLAGFCGQFSFAHAALAAVGAYSTVLIEETLGLGPGQAMPLAGLITATAGLFLGLLTLRVRGIYLALVTFAFAGAFVSWLAAAESITEGNRGHITKYFFEGIDRAPFVWLGLALVVGYFVSQSLILRSRWGLQLMAVRDREEIAQGLGVSTITVKVAVFAFTSFWAGVAGSFYAGYVGIVAPSIGSFGDMALIVAMVVIGGMGRSFGPIVGVLVLETIQYRVRDFGAEYTVLIFSTLALFVILFARNGLVGLAESTVARLRPRRGVWDDEEADMIAARD